MVVGLLAASSMEWLLIPVLLTFIAFGIFVWQARGAKEKAKRAQDLAWKADEQAKAANRKPRTKSDLAKRVRGSKGK